MRSREIEYQIDNYLYNLLLDKKIEEWFCQEVKQNMNTVYKVKNVSYRFLYNSLFPTVRVSVEVEREAMELRQEVKKELYIVVGRVLESMRKKDSSGV